MQVWKYFSSKEISGKKKTQNKSYSAICLLRNIQHVLKKKSKINFTASSVVQLHALVRKRLIANIIYKISCIEALKNISLYSRENYFFKRTHGIEFVWNSSTKFLVNLKHVSHLKQWIFTDTKWFVTDQVQAPRLVDVSLHDFWPSKLVASTSGCIEFPYKPLNGLVVSLKI